MEEEIYYEKKEDLTIYAEVKLKGAATTVPKGETAGRSRCCVLACVGVGILCALLMAGMVSIIYLEMELNEQRANHDAIRGYEKLTGEKSVLEQEMRNLRGVAKNLNRTLDFILSFDAFPVNEYCPEKKCQACPTDWILFKEKCYFFYEERPPWLSWMNSRRFCQEKQADLVVIDNLQEQEFISNNTEPYYDNSHGYFIGLEKMTGDWLWVDGRNDTLGYWMDTSFVDGPYALFIPKRTLTSSWFPGNNRFLNKFICEKDALIWST